MTEFFKFEKDLESHYFKRENIHNCIQKQILEDYVLDWIMKLSFFEKFISELERELNHFGIRMPKLNIDVAKLLKNKYTLGFQVHGSYEFVKNIEIKKESADLLKKYIDRTDPTIGA